MDRCRFERPASSVIDPAAQHSVYCSALGRGPRKCDLCAGMPGFFARNLWHVGRGRRLAGERCRTIVRLLTPFFYAYKFGTGHLFS